MDDFVGHLARLHPAGPPDDEGDAQAAFHGGVVGAAPGASGAAVGFAELGAVVAAENEDRVVAQAQFVHGAGYLPDAVVHFHHRIGEIPGAGAPREVGVRQGGEMQMHQRQVEKKWAARLGVLAHEADGAVHEFGVDAAAGVQVVELDVLGRLARPALHDVREVGHRGIEADRRCELAFVGGAGDAVPLVEAPVGRVAPGDVAQVPFAIVRRGIALGRQLLRQGDLVARQPLRQPRRNGLQAAGADGVAAAHQCRARGHAVAFHVEVLQQQAFGGQVVDVRRGGAAQGAAAVAAQFSPSQVVGHDQYDVGLLVHALRLVCFFGFMPGILGGRLRRNIPESMDSHKYRS
ncbi:hypothetical protein FQZ97_809890 [compost metagenome]